MWVGPQMTSENPRDASEEVSFWAFASVAFSICMLKTPRLTSLRYFTTIAYKVSVSSLMNPFIFGGLFMKIKSLLALPLVSVWGELIGTPSPMVTPMGHLHPIRTSSPGMLCVTIDAAEIKKGIQRWAMKMNKGKIPSYEEWLERWRLFREEARSKWEWLNKIMNGVEKVKKAFLFTGISYKKKETFSEIKKEKN